MRALSTPLLSHDPVRSLVLLLPFAFAFASTAQPAEAYHG